MLLPQAEMVGGLMLTALWDHPRGQYTAQAEIFHEQRLYLVTMELVSICASGVLN
jgi:hypothetical protein